MSAAPRAPRWTLVLLLFAGACRCSKAPTENSGEEAVEPVYGGAAKTPDPRARELCQALHALPAERRAACCGGAPGQTLVAECARMLSLALASGNVELDARRTAACLADQHSAFAGCGWVGPSAPPLPEVCQGLTVGKLDSGGRCRSSLECRDGLRCRGLGPTQAGVCDAPGAPTTACELGVDPLAVYLIQDSRNHPECAGTCLRRTCITAVAAGEACSYGGQCGPDAHCAAGHCAPGRFAKDGEPCSVGACAPGSVCHDGSCVPRKKEGGRCTTDEECLGACLSPDGGSGVCGMRCPR